MVTVIGSVKSPGDNSSDPSEPRCFVIETSVYDASKSAPMTFSVACFLENTKRWHNVKTLSTGALLAITSKITCRTTDTNQLALRVLDLACLPRPGPVPTATSTPASTPPSKRSARWEGQATPSTPSKRRRDSEGANFSGPSYENLIPQNPREDHSNVSIAEDSMQPSANLPSPATMADTDESYITLAPSPGPDGGTRPHRRRHPPKKYSHEDYGVTGRAEGMMHFP